MTSRGKLIVLAAFVENVDGELVPAFDPRQVDTEKGTRRDATTMADRYAGVGAMSPDADPSTGKYGRPVVLFWHREVPELR